MSSLANKVAKNTGLLYLRMGVTVFISLYTTRLVLGELGASDYGIFNLVGGAIAFFGFLNASLSSSTQRYMSYAEGKGDEIGKKKIFNISLILHFVLSIIVALILILAGSLFFDGFLKIPSGREHAAMIIYGSLIVSTVFTVMSVPYVSVLNAHENFKYYAIIGVVESLLKLAAAFVCVCSEGDKLIVYGLLMAIIPLFLLVVMRIYCYQHYEECSISLKASFEKKLSKDMAVFAGWNVLISFSAITTMQGVSLLLNYYGGVIANTAHGISNQLSGQATAFSSTMIKALNPALVKSYGAGQTVLMLKAAESGNKLSFACFSILAIPFIIEAPTVLSVWLNQTPLWAVLFCRLVFIRQIISQTYITFETCVRATGNIKGMTLASSLLWLFPMFLGILFYQMGAPIYTIYLLLIGLALFRGFVIIFYCHKSCGMNYGKYIKDSFMPMLLVALILMSLSLTHLFWNPSLLRCIVVCVVSITLFPILFYKLVLNNEEKEQSQTLLKAALDRVKKFL